MTDITKDQINSQADLNIRNVQQNTKLTSINNHSLKVLEAFSEYPMDYILCVLQTTVATALIEFSGHEDSDKNWKWNFTEAIDNASKFDENVKALITMNHQNNTGLVIVEK